MSARVRPRWSVTAARKYVANGWDPVPVNGKGTTPGGFTGYDGRRPTDKDITEWGRTGSGWQYSNTALHMRADQLGLDLDAYKAGAAAVWAGLLDELGPLPPTVVVSARFGDDWDGSGIRFYRLPPEYADQAGDRVWRGVLGDGIDVIRFGHRQAVVWPSIHRDLQVQVRYIDERDGSGPHAAALPAADELPELPPEWCKRLLKPVHDGSGREDDGADLWTEGDPCSAVATALEGVLSATGSRYDAMVQGQLRLGRLGEQGHRGTAVALETLHRTYVNRIGDERDAESEWCRALVGVRDTIELDGFTRPADRGCCTGTNDAAREWAESLRDRSFDAQTTLDDVHAVYRRWFGDGYDLGVLHAVLATAAAEQLDGDPPWLLVVGGSGSGKTETVTPLGAAPYALVTSTITSEGALLSATTAKGDKRSTANGGLLRRLGKHGLLIIKDATSILSMSRDSRAAVLAGLREVADGFWERNVGSEGGQVLTWEGRIVVVGAVTTAWDTAHSVIATMGDRFVLVRSHSRADRMATGRRAIGNTGSEVEMRAELRGVVGGILRNLSEAPLPSRQEADAILASADVVTMLRTPVEFEAGELVDFHDPEAPTRFTRQLTQIWRGAVALGLSRGDALALVHRLAADSIPPRRWDVVRQLATGATSSREIGSVTGLPYGTVRRLCQGLDALGLVHWRDIDERGREWRLSKSLPINAIRRLVDSSNYGGR